MSDQWPRAVAGCTAALLTAMMMAVTLPASGQEQSGCTGIFGGDGFESTGAAGPVTVYGSDLDGPLFDRFLRDIRTSAVMISREIGGLGSVEVCLFPETVPLDPAGLVPTGQQLHAVAFHDEGVLALGARNYGLIKPAAAFGLASLALWHTGPEPHPEPLATTIGQWYSARVLDRVAVNHNAMLYSALVSRTSEWPLVTGRQMPVRAWNPEFQESAASDLIEFAVGVHGPDVLTETSGSEWEAIGDSWSEALSAELRPDGLGTTWLWGGVIFFGSILLAALLAFIQWRNKRVKKRPEEWTEVLPMPVETGLEVHAAGRDV